VRPSKLVLENFGPYRERAEVDFSLLGPVFLVCGKTGSGKTSIFDAMTYALYGTAPGARGALERQLWSQHARPGEAPLVEFEFYLGGSKYRAVRNPPYRRPAKRGKAEFVEVESTAAFFRRETTAMGGEWKLLASSKTEVDAAIEERMGLSSDEFSKIILLPQGEFQRFLEMKSSDRVEVLEKLFPVALHDAVSSLAKERSREALAAVQRVDAELERLGGPEQAKAAEAELGELEARLEVLRGEREAAIARLSAAELALSRAREAAGRAEREKAARERLAELEAQAGAAAGRDERIAAGKKAHIVAPISRERAELASELDSVASSLASRRDQVALFVEQEPEIEKSKAEVRRLAEDLAIIDHELGSLAAAQDAWAKAAQAKAALENARAEAAGKASVLDAATEAEATAVAANEAAAVGADEEKAIRDAFDADNAASRAAQDSLREAERIATQASKAEKLRLAAERARAAAKGAQARRVAAEAALEAIEAEKEAAESEDMALRLALGLVPGSPCPVCGSLEHPAPAHAAIDAEAMADQAAKVSMESIARARAKDEASASAATFAALAEAADANAADATRELRALDPDAPDPGEAVPQACYAQSLGEAKAEADRITEALKVSAQRRRELEDRRRAALLAASAFEAARARKAEAEGAMQKAALEVARLEARLEATLAAAQAGAGAEDPTPLAAAARSRREKAVRERSALEAALSSYATGRREAEALEAEFTARSGTLELKLREAENREMAALKSSGFENLESARTAFVEQGELAKLEAEASAYASFLAASRAEVLAIATEREASKSAAPYMEEADEAALEDSVQAEREARDCSQAALDEAQARAQELEREREERRRLGAERAALDSAWSKLGGLSALLNGEMPGRRLPFKNYALADYFRVVVERASIRLAQMSDGRYALVSDEGSGRGYVGLDLLVRDSHTGQSRPAGTLSGGERFMSSLALALGLADTIRERSGGASLDAIFIDEGFGSLDDETLDRAISVLDEARGERTIGIVSHVAELRSRIPSRIEVTKGRAGSTLKIVT
jgi:exonuclease SbcC